MADKEADKDPESHPGTEPFVPDFDTGEDSVPFVPNWDDTDSHEFAVPAEGVIEYQHFVVDPGFATDTWVRAAEVRPGNRRVVHHCSVFLQPPSATGTDEYFETGALGSSNLIAF